ncbi:hypothetical protein ACNJX9_17775 [Bradyrhizobium sp. DASA03076]|uniref:hypothetical protein n=1 Tax=Bradyrhizobium sp. BLXBL-03 TaxID=3395916 RepID=UPI003F7008C4
MKKPEKESVQTAIRLPRQTHQWLSERSEGITDTIKRGLELVAIEETADEPTREFARLIFELAREVELETGAAWHADAGAYRTFRKAMSMANAKWRPAGVPDSTLEKVELKAFQDRSHASRPTNDTDELGVWLAHDVVDAPDREARARIRAAREKALKEIVKLHQTGGEEGNG